MYDIKQINSRKTILRVAIAAIIIVYSQQSFAQRATVSVTDYDEATSAYEEAYFSGTLNAGKSRADDRSAYDLNLGVDYDQVFASENRDLRLQANGTGSISRSGVAGTDRNSRYSYGLGATIDNYFNPASSPAFWYGSLNMQGNDAFSSRQISGIIGVGYGRVKNVTPMAKAIRVIEELMIRGQLSSEPPLAVYRAVANIIDREAEYRSKHGAADYEEVWVNDISNEIQSSGLVSDTYDAGDIIRVHAILTRERISTRRVGWKVRAGVGYVFRSVDGEGDSDPALEAGAEYYYPLSNQTQFSNEAVLTTILGGDQSYTFRNTMSLTHEVDDRIDWENAWTLTYDVNGPTDTDKTVNTLSTAFIYELRNQLDFTATLALTNYSGAETAASQNGTDTSLFLGLRYRLK